MKQSTLSEREIEMYHQDGYVVPRYRLPSDRLRQLQKMCVELVEENPAQRDKMLTCPHVQRAFMPGAGHNLKTSHSEEWMSFALEPNILDAIEALIGPDIIFWSSVVFYKRAGGGPATPWHRDDSFLPIKPAATASAWIAVFDSTVDNGCLRFIPGTQRGDSLGVHINSSEQNLVFPNTLEISPADEARARDVEVEAGQMVIFDVRTVHGARANTGEKPRAGFSLRYMPSTSYFDHDEKHGTEPYQVMKDKDYETRPLYLVRGIDRSGRNDFRKGHAAA